MVYRPKKREPREVIHNAIKEHAGLSNFDDEMIAHETAYILKELEKAGFSIIYEG